MNEKHVIPKLIGGLGNQLFILAAAMDIAIRSGRILIFNGTPGNPHSDEKRTLNCMFPNIPIIGDIIIDGEYAGSDFVWNDILPRIDNKYTSIYISGYNQHPKYIPDGFCNFIDNIPDQTPYVNMSDTAFLHVRRGDYVNHTIFEINSDLYYTTAVKDLLQINPGVKILIISDDTTWSNTYITELLQNIIPLEQITYLNREYTATETLKIMANCLGGAICANSSFSWWGAYVNKNRPIYMPQPWCSYDLSESLGLYFENVKRIAWKTGVIF
jgi:hypothetical protein